MEIRNCFSYLPIWLMVSVVTAFFTTYAVATLTKHVAPIWPYISDIGCKNPENPVFSQLVKLAIVIWYINVYLRYIQIEGVSKSTSSSDPPRRLNTATAWIGIISGQGLSMLANFSTCDMKYVHLIGLFLFALFGVIYFCIQTYISRKAIKWLFGIRLFFCAVIIIGTIVTASFFTKYFFNGTRQTFWKSGKNGEQIAGALWQWIAIFAGSAFVVTFYWEFRLLIFTYPSLEFTPK